MPIYEYRCGKCRKIFNFLVRNLANHRPPSCPRCGKKYLERVISPFRIGQSDERRMEKLADPSSLAGLDENDPRSMGRWMKKMSGALGEDMPEDMDNIAERLESGESPKDIEGSQADGGERDTSGELYDG